MFSPIIRLRPRCSSLLGRSLAAGLMAALACLVGCGGPTNDELLAEARQLIADQEYQEAINRLQLVIDDDPEQLEARKLIASAMQQRGLTGAAMEHLNYYLVRDQSDAEVYLMRARSHLDARDLQAAETDASEAIQLNPELADAYIIRAQVWLEERQWRSLSDDLAEAEAQGGDMAEISVLRRQAEERYRWEENPQKIEYTDEDNAPPQPGQGVMIEEPSGRGEKDFD